MIKEYVKLQESNINLQEKIKDLETILNNEKIKTVVLADSLEKECFMNQILKKKIAFFSQKTPIHSHE